MITGLRGVVLIDANDAVHLCRALDALAERGVRLVGPAQVLVTHLRKAAANASNLGPNVRVSPQSVSNGVRSLGGQGDSGQDMVHEITSREAAQDLGCTPANARDLARRGKLRHRKVGGRLYFDAADVAARANRYRGIPWT